MNNMNYWHGVRGGSIVVLSDPQSLEEAPEGIRTVVTETQYIPLKDVNDEIITEYRLITLESEDNNYLLVVIGLEDNILIRCYYAPSGIIPGTREELLGREDYWLFLEPEDPDNFIPSDLLLSPCITTPEIDGESLAYDIHGFEKTLYGITDIMGVDVPVQLTEYKTETICSNPYMLITEHGWLDTNNGVPFDAGGFLEVYLGCDIDPLDIKVL